MQVVRKEGEGMSYCRFTEGDVYSYECDGGVQFYVAVGGGELDRLCNTFNEAYQYAKALRDTYGLDVPSHAIEALKADALEEAVCICGPDGAVAELGAENEKLRELVRDLYMALWTCNQHTCKHGNDGCYTEDGNSGGRCTLHDRMYELGVGL